MNSRWMGLMAAVVLQPMLWGQVGTDGVEARRRTISVTGNGEAAAAPDQAVVRLGASIQTGQADVSHARVNEIMEKALEAIEKVGVPRRAIRTTGLSLQPVSQ